MLFSTALPAGKQSQFWHKNIEEKALRQQLKTAGIDARRLSRLTQFCLAAALPLQAELTAETAVYLGSMFSSPSKFNKLFTQLNEQQIPSPLDFMANINNAPTFHLAQQFDLKGNSVFLVVNQHNFLQPLKLALLDLAANVTQQALVGWALEDVDVEKEQGAVWFLVKQENLAEWKNVVPVWDAELQQKQMAFSEDLSKLFLNLYLNCNK